MIKIFISIFCIALLLTGAFLIYRDVNKRQSEGKGLFDSLDESNNQSPKVSEKDKITLEPKHPKIGKCLIYLSYLILVAVLISFVYLFFFKESCNDLFGWNVDFLRNLLIFILVSIYAIFSFETVWNFFRLRTYTGKYYPKLDKQPLLFKKECTLINEIYIKESKSESIKAIIDTATMLLIYVICFMMISESIFPISQSNEAYHQACLSEVKK